jgi:hypothetical protein
MLKAELSARVSSWRPVSDNLRRLVSYGKHQKNIIDSYRRTVKRLNKSQLDKEIGKYDHVTRNTMVIAFLGLGAFFSGLAAVYPLIDSSPIYEVLPLVSAIPAGLGVASISFNRGEIRKKERNILLKQKARLIGKK